MATYDQLKNALVQADQKGDTQAAQLFADKIKNKDYDEESSGVASALQGFSQGATLGFGDEAAAGIRSAVLDPLVSSIFGGDIGGVGGQDMSLGESIKDYFGGMGERYQMNLGSQRQALEAARREDPWTTGIAELAGGLGTGGVGGIKAVAGQGLAKGAARLAGAGAGIGGAAGYGYGEADPLAAAAFGTPEETKREVMEAVKSAGVGAATGAALGGALPVVGAGARAVTRVIARPFTKNARLNEEGRRTVLAALQDDVDAGYINMDDAAKELRATPGMTAADLGPAMRELTETVAQRPSPGGRQLREALETRNKEQYKRIFPKLSEAIGAKGRFGPAKRQLINDMREKADNLYGVAYQQPVRMTGRMKEILATPSGKAALRQGKLLRADLEKNPEALDIAGAMQSTRDLDYIVQSFDDVVSGYFKGGAGKRGMAAKDLRNEFRQAIYDANPDYRDARAAWAGDKANENAMDLGTRIFRDDADLVADTVREMSESERQFFKIGTLDAITKKLGNKSDTSDLTKGIFDRPNARDAVQVAFGGRQPFNEFMGFIGQEQKMFNTFKQATQNSATAKRLAQGSDAGGKLAALLGYTGSLSTGAGLPPSIGGYMGRKVYETVVPAARRQARERAVSGRQADLLMTQNLKDITQPQTVGGLLGRGAQPTVGAGVGGLLATGEPEIAP